MNVLLPSELERLVTDKVQSGTYNTASEVVCDALRLMQERDEAAKIQALRQDIQVAIDQIARGEFTEYTIENIHLLEEKVKARGRKRLAAQSPKRRR